MWTRLAVVVSTLGCGCSDKPAAPAKPTAKPTARLGTAAADDRCVTAVDKVFTLLKRKGHETDPRQQAGAVEQCRRTPNDPTVACLLTATDDPAVERCMSPASKPEPVGQLAQMTENLQTYFFVHETFTDQKLGLVPAIPCCQFPTKKCPPQPAPDAIWTDVLKLDLTKDRDFQYRFESSSTKAVLEAVGDRDCDGKAVTYRRELERRADGNMHITVLDPPAGSD